MSFQGKGTVRRRGRAKPEEFLLPVFGPKSKIGKENSLHVFTYLDNDDMADVFLVSKLWNKLSLETEPGQLLFA